MHKPKTLFERVWDSHVVMEREGEPTLLYIDLHLVHEVTSPQAFEGLRLANRKVRRPELTFATIDHNIPTTSDERFQIKDQVAAQQIATLRSNCESAAIPLFDVGSGRQGIVHVIGPELGLTQPGMTVVCGDSHTSTHGAFGALAFGVGTSEVEHVLATQCVSQKKPRSMRISISGTLPEGTSSKDLILDIIRRLGTDGGTGYVIEYTGEVVRGLTMEERMTMCNMSIECGARAGMVARAPHSMLILHIVMRSSIVRPRTTSPAYSMTYPVPPSVPNRRIMSSIKSLDEVPSGSVPETEMRMLRGFFWDTHCVANTCSTSEVPTPNAKAPKAPWVLVWLSPQTTVMPGCVSPSSGPMTCTIPCRPDPTSNNGIPALSQLRRRVAICRAATWSLI